MAKPDMAKIAMMHEEFLLLHTLVMAELENLRLRLEIAYLALCLEGEG